MTQSEKDKTARTLGITPEACPWAWECDYCGYTSMRCNCSDNGADWYCALPDPDSDDPAACVWDGFLMRALDVPSLVRGHSDVGCFYGLTMYSGATTTAALLAAWQGREGK